LFFDELRITQVLFNWRVLKLGNRVDDTVQTASATNSVSVQNQTVSTGVSLAWTASDILQLYVRGTVS
jgi:hypothetical protein